MLKAAENGDTQLCLRLVKNGANVNAAGWVSALDMAAAYGHTASCLLLLELGSDVDRFNRYGRTTLHLAALHGHCDICLILMEHGFNPLLKDEKCQTAVDLALEYRHDDCAGAIQSVITAQAARVALEEINSAGALKVAAP